MSDGDVHDSDTEAVLQAQVAVLEQEIDQLRRKLADAPKRQRALEERLPGVHVSLSHEVVGTFREYERAATTELDAALSPLLGSYLRRLVERAGEAGLPEPANFLLMILSSLYTG